LLTAFIAPSCSRSAEPPTRLPNQIYNRMVYVRTGDDSEVFVDMPDHFDLGSPSISPDSKWIAFDALTIGKSPRREAWLVGVDGKGLRKLADAGTPRWSPDGKRLLICREVAGFFSRQHKIYEFEIATGKEKLVREGRFPDWSPDGKKIVFAVEGSRTENAGMHPGSKLWTAAADGTAAAELCDGNWPSWSPDGKKIAYCVQAENKPGEIWTIDLDTKRRTKIALGHYRAQWTGDSKGFVCNGSFPIPGETTYSRAPARFRLDKPLQPAYFDVELDNPWSPCVSRDDQITVLIVDSQKLRDDDSQ
jgi:hypothetical protein